MLQHVNARQPQQALAAADGSKASVSGRGAAGVEGHTIAGSIAAPAPDTAAPAGGMAGALEQRVLPKLGSVSNDGGGGAQQCSKQQQLEGDVSDADFDVDDEMQQQQQQRRRRPPQQQREQKRPRKLQRQQQLTFTTRTVRHVAATASAIQEPGSIPAASSPTVAANGTGEAEHVVAPSSRLHSAAIPSGRV